MNSGFSHVTSRRLVCPESGFDAPGTITMSEGRIKDLEEHAIPDRSSFGSDLVLPGLIDIHCHLGAAHSVFGVDPSGLLRSGTTFAGSQGDAGAGNIDRYVEEVVRPARLKVKLAINLSMVGESTEAGCFSDPTWVNIDACVDAVDRNRDYIWAIAINASHHACPAFNPHALLNAGLKVADETGLPILYGLRRPEDWGLGDQLSLLRQGDVVTYCFRKSPHCIVYNNQVLGCVIDARKRGVLFDVGHGCGSFDFDVAETAVRCGFLPDTISTDLQARHVTQGMRHDLPLVMSKLRAVGMREADIFQSVTSTPAKLVGAIDRGKLTVGSRADLTCLIESDRKCKLVDTSDKERYGKVWSAAEVFVRGEVVKK